MSSKDAGFDWDKLGFPLGLGLAFTVLGVLCFVAIVGNLRLADSPAPPLPPGVPADVPELYSTAEAGEPAYLISLGQDPHVTVEFDQRNSIKGLWAGSNASFHVDAPYAQDLAASTHSETWGNTLVSQAPSGSFTPWLDVKLPLGEEDFHRWISATASLDVVYPARATALAFSNTSAHLERSLRFFVISRQESEMLKTHRIWKSAVDDRSKPWATAFQFIFPVLFLVCGVGLLVGVMLSRRG